MLFVIADDITGAAEIAGMAHRYGLRTTLTTSAPSSVEEGTDVVVFATDARSVAADEAYAMTAAAAKAVSSCSCGNGESIIFRKTDSALRGNVREELQAILDNSRYTNALYVPANPSKGRMIRNGIYYIDDIPIAETDFRFDPEFPAVTSSVADRFPGLPFADAVSKADIDRAVASALTSGDTLLAGAADLFCSLVENVFSKEEREPAVSSSPIPPSSPMIVVRGSTQSKALDLGIPVETMPLDVFYERADASSWAEAILPRYERAGSTVLTIGDKEVRTGKHAAVYLRSTMAEVCCSLLDAVLPAELVIEGGATAFAILSRTPWQTFAVTDEIAPGVVRIKPLNAGIHITMKPGSYAWGNLFGK
ncbi:MAG: hypothetical protein NC344_02945 [Bacteroidales bacterium]|nr:hypothetical protein [Bacteroidales bacterium]MCM1146789.1 hypothetical protein [Bacteroidales bacterium]MCM1205714.1 hypothetical protein [Bacillota bacterium]MCM1510756.1 hypothetical protein [Clostridium sp.]